jgi:hypothetical protein
MGEHKQRYNKAFLPMVNFVNVPSCETVKKRGVCGKIPPPEPWHAKYCAFISSVMYWFCSMLARATDVVQDMQEYTDFSPILEHHWRRPPKPQADHRLSRHCAPRDLLRFISDLPNSPRRIYIPMALSGPIAMECVNSCMTVMVAG